MADKSAVTTVFAEYMQIVKTLNYKYTNLINSQLSDANLTRSQCETLLWLYGNGSSQTDTELLLRAFKVSRATMSQTLTELSKKGFIEYGNPPDDKRSKRIALTDKAKDVCARLICEADNLNRSLFFNVTAAEYKTSNKVLNKLINNIRKLEDTD